MANNNSVQKSKTGKSQPAGFYKKIKKKHLMIITFAMAVIIIVLAVFLIISGTSNSAGTPQKEGSAVSADAEEETTEPALSYEEDKWMKQMKSGFLFYNDENYTCSTGIDVSEWSLDIDWEKVKAAGIDFAIIRVGYRGYGTGKFQFDTKMDEYLSGAEAAGIKTGVYFVTQAVDEAEAVEEAEAVLEKIKDYSISMPVYIDSEANSGEDTRTDDLTKEQYTKNAIAFCKRVEEAGYRGGIYSNETWIGKHLDMSQLTDYDIWFAKYTNTPDTDIPFTMWQYSATGSVDGITTDADLNIRIEKKN